VKIRIFLVRIREVKKIVVLSRLLEIIRSLHNKRRIKAGEEEIEVRFKRV
jgi:hypothetical protein